MLDRRKFLEAGAAAGVAAMIPVKIGRAAETMARTGTAGAAAAVPGAVGVSPVLTKYVDALPIPGAIAQNGVNATTGAAHYDVAAVAFTHKMHRDLPPTPVWGYQPVDAAGNVPANPVLYSHGIIANVNQPVEVNWINGLRPTDVHPLEFAAAQRGVTIDRANVDGMLDPAGNPWPDQRITTHLHGGHVPWQSDGGPKTWYTGPFFSPTGPYVAGSSVVRHPDPTYTVNTTYAYPNNQAATTLWYHDHAMGITRYNVLAGLASFYLLENPAANAQFNLPFGIPIVIQDRIFNADGTLYHPPAPLVPEFFGDTIIVNGKAWPKLDVAAGQYRLRLLNGCNARFLRMQFVVAPGGVLPSVRNWKNLPFTQIGAEGGLFPAPAPSPIGNQLLLAPAERADVIVDFSSLAATGGTVILYNDAATPFSGTTDTRGAIPEIMMFNVLPGAGPTITLPASFAPYGGFVDQNGVGTLVAPNLVGAANVPKVLTEIALPNGLLMQLINNVGYEFDPVTMLPAPPDVATLGSTEIWQIVNATVDTHPIHMHQAMFQVIGRYKFGTSQFLSKTGKKGVMGQVNPLPFVKGALLPPEFNEVGWKDTIRANPGELTLIAVKWVEYPGNYVYHCHILEHEEHDMMRALTIV